MLIDDDCFLLFRDNVFFVALEQFFRFYRVDEMPDKVRVLGRVKIVDTGSSSTLSTHGLHNDLAVSHLPYSRHLFPSLRQVSKIRIPVKGMSDGPEMMRGCGTHR